MAPRSLRIEREKLQRARRPLQHDVLSRPFMPVLSNSASPTIFISRSILDSFSPTPSPLAAATAESQHHVVPTAEAVGEGVAGVVALVAVLAVIYRVFGKKIGLCGLLGPLCTLLSCCGGKFVGPFTRRLNSLRKKLQEWTPASRRRRTSLRVDDDEAKSTRADDSRHMPDKVTDGSLRRAHRAEHVATAQVSLEQLEMDTKTFLVTTVDSFIESELKKVDEFIMQPISEEIAKAQVYAQSLIFSVTENISDEDRSSKRSSDAHPEEASKSKADASDHIKASVEVTAAVHEPLREEVVSMVSAGSEIKATSKTTNTIASENEVGRKTLKNVQEPVTLQEQVVLQRKQGKEPLTSNGENEIEIAEEVGKQGMHLNDRCKSGQVRIVQIGTPEEVSAPSSPHKHETHSSASGTSHTMSSVITDTGGIDNVWPESGTILVPEHTKAVVPMTGRTMIPQVWKSGEGNARKARRSKRKRPKNLGHVSFSCDISAHNLRFFTACKSGGTYGSPPASPAEQSISIKNRNYYNHYHDRRIIRAADNYDSHSQPYTAQQVDQAPLYNPSHYYLMQQQHHPSQPILVQHNPVAPTLQQHTCPLSSSLDATDYKSSSHRPPNPVYNS